MKESRPLFEQNHGYRATVKVGWSGLLDGAARRGTQIRTALTISPSQRVRSGFEIFLVDFRRADDGMRLSEGFWEIDCKNNDWRNALMVWPRAKTVCGIDTRAYKPKCKSAHCAWCFWHEQPQVRRYATCNTAHTNYVALIEAHMMLAEIYRWVTEGFNTQDLQEAKALLTELQ